jgi:hypothetical protein
MGTGSSALLWYFACLAFVALVVGLAAGLIVYGRLKEGRARAKRRQARVDASPSSGTLPSPETDRDDGSPA